MRRPPANHLSTLQACAVKLVLLAGTVGFLYAAGLLPGSSPATKDLRPERPPVQAATVVRVDINHGSLDDLQTLPGIGAVLAERILRYRRENGSFTSMADIQNVKGIGAKRFNQLRPYIHVGRYKASFNG